MLDNNGDDDDGIDGRGSGSGVGRFECDVTSTQRDNH